MAIVAALVLGLLVASTAVAQGELAPVRLNGIPVLEVVGTGEEPARARAARVERRLQRVSDRPDLVGVPSVVPGSASDSRVIELQGLPILTVTRVDAEEAVATVGALAHEWAASLGRAIVQARASRVSPWRRISDEARGSISMAASRLTWSIGMLVAADVLGFEPGAVITGLGLTGLALGFTLKDIISNFVSGIIILGLRPFEIGDEIVVGPTEGTVHRIQLRATAIRTYDGRLVLGRTRTSSPPG